MVDREKKLNLINNGVDRLSSLPDNLLITILSLLPFDSTVATSVLSRRWRHLWTLITHISFIYNWHRLRRKCKLHEAFKTINDAIFKLTSPKLHTFILHLPPYTNDKQVCNSILVPCFEVIFSRNPQVIKLFSIDDRSSLLLPASLFTTQSLVELELGPGLEFNFGDSQILINLPNLKKLRMFLRDSHRRLMLILLKSCPLLEHLDLNLDLKENDQLVDVLAPNLKFLNFNNYSLSCSLIIDAPNLEQLFTYANFGPSYNFVNDLRCLKEVTIGLAGFGYGVGDENRAKVLALFKGISCVRYLNLHSFFRDDLSDVALPVFHNLVRISVDDYYIDAHSWVPSCLLNNVKSLDIEMEPNEHGIRLLGDILSNATVLELLQVYLNDGYNEAIKTRFWEEYKFAVKLFKLPRISPNCHIVVRSSILTASSEDFKCGRLTCQIVDQNYDSHSNSE